MVHFLLRIGHHVRPQRVAQPSPSHGQGRACPQVTRALSGQLQTDLLSSAFGPYLLW